MTTLIPLEDHILVEPVQEDAVTKSGIILPESNKEKPSKWTIIAVGPGKILDNGTRSSMDVTVWQVVYFTKYSPDELDLDGKKYLVVRHSSLLAVEK
jgi:chaperonin GroES